MAFVMLSTPRKSFDFAECQISLSKRIVFYLLGPSSGPWPGLELGSGLVRVRVRVRGLGLGPWSCHLLHGNNEGWITLSCPKITKKVKGAIHHMVLWRKKCYLWLSFCYLPLGSLSILPNVKFRCPNGSCFTFWGRLLARDHLMPN